MKAPIQDFLSRNRCIDFGRAPVRHAEQDFYTRLNGNIIELCRSLPDSVHIEAIDFLMQYGGLAIGDHLDFYSKYPVPCWSILYWISAAAQNRSEEQREVMERAITIHAMAMLLHSLDDHLNDGELAATHLVILLRSQAWHRMMTAIKTCCGSFPDDKAAVQAYINAYYQSICGGSFPDSLNGYCEHFRRQMSTGMIAPDLVMRRSGASRRFMADILRAFGHFGVAWRLLDDIQDIEQDLHRMHHSAVYYCLPVDIQSCWSMLGQKKSDQRERFAAIVCDRIIEKNIVMRLIKKIVRELESAAALTKRQNLTGLAAEFKILQEPLCEIERDRS